MCMCLYACVYMCVVDTPHCLRFAVFLQPMALCHRLSHAQLLFACRNCDDALNAGSRQVYVPTFSNHLDPGMLPPGVAQVPARILVDRDCTQSV